MALFGGKQKARRASAMAFAQANGLQFAEEDRFGLFALPIELFERTSHNACTNIVYGSWQGQNMWAFELVQHDVHGPDRYRCAATPLPTECPHIEITRTNELWRVGNKLGIQGQDLSFESEAFNRGFRVSTADTKFGYDLVTEPMMDWLLAAPKEWRFAVSKNYAVTYRPMDGDEETFSPQPLDVMKGFWDHLPGVLASLYELKGPLIPVMGTADTGDLGPLIQQALGALGMVIPAGSVVPGDVTTEVTEVTIGPGGQVISMGGSNEALRTSGVPGTATVVAVHDTGVVVSGAPIVTIDLEVTVEGRPPYRPSHPTPFPPTGATSPVPGATLPVRVDPNDPNRILVEWDRA